MKNTQKTLKRKRTRLAKILLWAAIISYLLMTLFDFATIFDVVAFFCLPAGLILLELSNRCPYCGKRARTIEWSKPDAGNCKKCGKLMEYDDTVAKRNAERAAKAKAKAQ